MAQNIQQNGHDEIVRQIQSLNVGPGQSLRQVMVPDTAYAIARNFLKWAPNITIGPDNKPLYCRFRCLYYLNLSGESIYGLLMVDAGNTTLAEAGQKIEVWKEAIKSLLRYALNLKLAPKRPEFQRMKVCQWTCCVCMCVCMVSVYVYVYPFDVHGFLMTTWLQSCCPVIHKEPLCCVMHVRVSYLMHLSI